MSSNPKKQAPARSVLGNDPFQRGAAPTAPSVAPLAASSAPARTSDEQARPTTLATPEPARPTTQPLEAARPTSRPARPPKRTDAESRPETRPDRPRKAKAAARAETADLPRLPTRDGIPGTQPAAVTSFARKGDKKKARPESTRPETVKLRPSSRKPAPVAREPDSDAQPRVAPEAGAIPPSNGEQPAVDRALIKRVLVPEVETGPVTEPPKAEPRAPKPSPLGALAQVAMKRAQGLLGQLAGSPVVLKGAAAAISGTSAVRALMVRPDGVPQVDEFGQDPALVARSRPAVDFLYRHYFRVTAEGTENLPAHGPLLAICNHAGALPIDGLIVRSALERARPGEHARWLTEDAIFHAPFVGTWLNRLGAVRACPENAFRLLEEGNAVVVFPEGVNGLTKTFRRRYQLQRFGRGGFVKLALRSGAPLVPTAILGSEESTPVLATLPARTLGLPVLPLTPTLLPLPTKWVIAFCKPIDLSKYGPDDANDLALVQRLTEAVRTSIHERLAQLRATRHSVFRG